MLNCSHLFILKQQSKLNIEINSFLILNKFKLTFKIYILLNVSIQIFLLCYISDISLNTNTNSNNNNNFLILNVGPKWPFVSLSTHFPCFYSEDHRQLPAPPLFLIQTASLDSLHAAEAGGWDPHVGGRVGAISGVDPLPLPPNTNPLTPHPPVCVCCSFELVSPPEKTHSAWL